MSNQKKIDYSRRGAELKALADARFGCPYRRLILRELDDMIRDGACWEMTIEYLADRCEISRRTCYRKLGELVEANIVSVEDLPGSTRKRFRIARSNIADCRVRRAARSPRRDEPPCPTGTDSCHTGTTVCHTGTRPCPTGTDLCHTGTDTSISAPSATLPPPPPLSAHEAAAAELIELGVAHPEPALSLAVDRSGLEHVRLIIAYFREQAPRQGWRAGALVTRLRNASPVVPVALGWPRPDATRMVQQRVRNEAQEREAARQKADALRTKERERRQKREATWGPVLDSLDSSEQGALAERALHPEQLRHYRRSGITSVVRDALLKALETASNAGVPAP